MAKHTYGNPESYRGYTIVPRYTEGRLTLCDVWDGDKHVRGFYGPDARDKAKLFISRRIADERFKRISIRRVSGGR